MWRCSTAMSITRSSSNSRARGDFAVSAVSSASCRRASCISVTAMMISSLVLNW